MDRVAIVMSILAVILALLIIIYILYDRRAFEKKANKKELNLANMRRTFKRIDDEVIDEISGENISNLIDINTELRKERRGGSDPD